ncbi:GntR family transcriptional regulator [Deinococcus sp. QL22]|uniref:GntR family transcriptional regulator n=1 Tax=Deinococcus sp. QL22 TaxID=2939437 RepID=UPI002016A836|nr:GntR family transcriptional regulator [Deinococcus sp. QL22]UQN08367.1 GntR family transcriptional regulator [Deinococcus sp. QL22]
MPLPLATSALPRTLAREEAYICLRDWIVQGVLAPGEALRDQDIAARLGVSRTPVREALRRLEDEGLVETALNRWTRVAPLDLTRAAELYPLIEALEVLALDMAAPTLTEQDLHLLTQANEDLRRALEGQDAGGAVAADEAFHGVWLARAGNRELAIVLGQLRIKLRRVELAYFDAGPRGHASVAEHAALLDAVRERRWHEAKGALHQNWRGSLERLQNQLNAVE